MIKLYKTNRDLQIEWMKKNPGKTIAINVGLGAAYIIYLEWKSRDLPTSIFYKKNQTES